MITPIRQANGYRTYSPLVVETIKLYLNLGLSTEQIAGFLHCVLKNKEAFCAEVMPPYQTNLLKVNCDDLPELAAEAGVMSMPTVIVFKEGQPMEKLVGLRPRSAYQGVLNKYVQAPSIL